MCKTCCCPKDLIYVEGWHTDRQYDGAAPVIRKTYEGWECFLEADGISALGKTPTKAWKAKTISVEKGTL